MFCEQCGCQVLGNVKFCDQCGAPLQIVSVSAANTESVQKKERPKPVIKDISKAQAVTGFVLAIFGALFSLVPGILALVLHDSLSAILDIVLIVGIALSLTGLIMGSIARKRQTKFKIAKAGWIISLVSFIIGLVCLVTTLIMFIVYLGTSLINMIKSLFQK